MCTSALKIATHQVSCLIWNRNFKATFVRIHHTNSSVNVQFFYHDVKWNWRFKCSPMLVTNVWFVKFSLFFNWRIPDWTIGSVEKYTLRHLLYVHNIMYNHSFLIILDILKVLNNGKNTFLARLRLQYGFRLK
jgi:hypothetical protein